MYMLAPDIFIFNKNFYKNQQSNSNLKVHDQAFFFFRVVDAGVCRISKNIGASGKKNDVEIEKLKVVQSIRNSLHSSSGQKLISMCYNMKRSFTVGRNKDKAHLADGPFSYQVVIGGCHIQCFFLLYTCLCGGSPCVIASVWVCVYVCGGLSLILVSLFSASPGFAF